MHFIGRVTMLFANNSLMECLITMKFLHIFFTPCIVVSLNSGSLDYHDIILVMVNNFLYI